ncbi:hypothetical protein GCM10027075_16550 [Streptomyces heilongjiangensis]
MVPDTLGGDVRTRSLDALRPGGTLVTIVPTGFEDDAGNAAEPGVRLAVLLVEADRAGMRAVADLVAEGKLRLHVDAAFPLAEAGKAHVLGETGRTTGRSVLTVR